MTEVFESYEQEFAKYTNISNKKLETFQSYSNDKKEQIINEIQYELSQADFSLKSMKTEISTQPQMIRQQANQKIRKYQQELDQQRRKLIKLENEYQNQKNKENLMGARLELSDMSGKENKNFLQSGQILSDGSTKLQGALATGHEALEIADNIQSELYRQNEILDGNIQKNKNVRSDISQANNLISQMRDTIRRNKFVLWGLVAFLSLVIFIIVYFRFIYEHEDNNNKQLNSNQQVQPHHSRQQKPKVNQSEKQNEDIKNKGQTLISIQEQIDDQEDEDDIAKLRQLNEKLGLQFLNDMI